MKLPADTGLWRFGRRFFASFIRKQYKISTFGEIPEPPFLLVANHTNFMDPFFIGSVLRYPVVWIAASGNFRRWLIGPLLKAVGAISKQKGYPDIRTIRYIFRTLNIGGIVGLFPEGSVTWDGNFQKVPKGTDKLLKKVKVPIVCSLIHGGYLTKPRWADKRRNGVVHIEFKSTKPENALQFISESEWEWQGRNRIRFLGSKRALGIQRILWFCPKCKHFHTIKPEGNIARCTHCGYEVKIDEYGYINGDSVDKYVPQQKEILWETFSKSDSFELEQGVLEVSELRTGKRLGRIKGGVRLTRFALQVGEQRYLYDKITGVTTFLKRILEFIYDNQVIRLRTNTSSFLIYQFLNMVFAKRRSGGE